MLRKSTQMHFLDERKSRDDREKIEFDCGTIINASLCCFCYFHSTPRSKSIIKSSVRGLT